MSFVPSHSSTAGPRGYGRCAFAVMLIFGGALDLVRRDFTGIWEPVANSVPARAALPYLCAAISLLGGAGLLWRRTAVFAARVLLIFFLAWLLLMRLPAIYRAPTTQDPWSGGGETAVFAATAWVLYAAFAGDNDRRGLRFATGAQGVNIGRALYGLALLPFGTAHFAYLNETASLVPAYLPLHRGIAGFTGAAFLAAGIGILLRAWARLAAALSTIQMGAFTLLVWMPILAAGTPNAFQLSEAVLSVALTAAGWVVADSYAGTRWLSRR